MKKSDLDSIDTGRKSSVFAQVAQATGTKGMQTPPSEEEKADRLATGHTQGRKGCAACRINMAFTPENYEFLKTISKANGVSITKLVNTIIKTYRKEHPEYMKKVEELRAFGGLDFDDED